MGNPPCVHYEVITSSDKGSGEEIGTCQKCGRVKRYYWENHGIFRMERKSEIIKHGGNEVPKIKMGPFKKLSNKLLQELYEIGPDAFGDKYHYLPQRRESITKIYQKHQDEIAVQFIPGTVIKESPSPEPLTLFEESTQEIITNLNAELETKTRVVNELSITIETVKQEIIAYRTALDLYRNRYGGAA